MISVAGTPFYYILKKQLKTLKFIFYKMTGADFPSYHPRSFVHILFESIYDNFLKLETNHCDPNNFVFGLV